MWISWFGRRKLNRRSSSRRFVVVSTSCLCAHQGIHHKRTFLLCPSSKPTFDQSKGNHDDNKTQDKLQLVVTVRGFRNELCVVDSYNGAYDPAEDTINEVFNKRFTTHVEFSTLTIMLLTSYQLFAAFVCAHARACLKSRRTWIFSRNSWRPTIATSRRIEHYDNSLIRGRSCLACCDVLLPQLFLQYVG